MQNYFIEKEDIVDAFFHQYEFQDVVLEESNGGSSTPGTNETVDIY